MVLILLEVTQETGVEGMPEMILIGRFEDVSTTVPVTGVVETLRGVSATKGRSQAERREPFS